MTESLWTTQSVGSGQHRPPSLRLLQNFSPTRAPEPEEHVYKVPGCLAPKVMGVA